MTCKDCIHFEVCDSGRHIGEYTQDDGVYTDGVEKHCPTFKDRLTPIFRKPVPSPAPMSCYEFELLPCPFCGGKAQMVRIKNPRPLHFVTCLVCGVEMPRIAHTRKEAKEVWNRRVDEQPPWPKENPHVIAHPVVHQAERFFTAKEVRAMSQEEVRKNYEAIMQSMKKW